MEDKDWESLVQEYIPPESRSSEQYIPSVKGDMWQLGVSLMCMIYGKCRSEDGELVPSSSATVSMGNQKLDKK